MLSKHRGRAAILLLTIVASNAWIRAAAAAQSSPQQSVFTVPDASKLMNEVNEGLFTRDAGKFLAAFDLAKMSAGQLFKQQITSFISHSDSIRMHFNITETNMNAGKGAASVEAEMEADSRDGNTPPLHKQATLHFVAERTPAGWKFTDVDPRSFFSASSGAAPSAGTRPQSQ
jgi:hypothetical protein